MHEKDEKSFADIQTLIEIIEQYDITYIHQIPTQYKTSTKKGRISDPRFALLTL